MPGPRPGRSGPAGRGASPACQARAVGARAQRVAAPVQRTRPGAPVQRTSPASISTAQRTRPTGPAERSAKSTHQARTPPRRQRAMREGPDTPNAHACSDGSARLTAPGNTRRQYPGHTGHQYPRHTGQQHPMCTIRQYPRRTSRRAQAVSTPGAQARHTGRWNSNLRRTVRQYPRGAQATSWQSDIQRLCRRKRARMLRVLPSKLRTAPTALK